jgi:hypothetical protein
VRWKSGEERTAYRKKLEKPARHEWTGMGEGSNSQGAQGLPRVPAVDAAWLPGSLGEAPERQAAIGRLGERADTGRDSVVQLHWGILAFGR